MNGERDLDPKNVDSQKKRFIELIRSSVSDDLVLKAFRVVDRADFIESEEERNFAYENRVICLGEGSSISEPVLVAKMMENLYLTGREKVLEVGTGSGYGAALLSKCAREVYTIEYNQSLAQKASERLKKLKINNVHVVIGDGALGIPGASPFDAIIITAACRDFPPALVEQLTEGGRILAPIGNDPKSLEQLTLGLKMYGRLFYSKPITHCRFYPLISEEEGGFSNDYFERLFRMRMVLFKSLAKKKGKTFEEFLQEGRETEPKFRDLSDKAIIELVPIFPEDFDYLSSNLEDLEEEIKRKSTTISEA